MELTACHGDGSGQEILEIPSGSGTNRFFLSGKPETPVREGPADKSNGSDMLKLLA